MEIHVENCENLFCILLTIFSIQITHVIPKKLNTYVYIRII